MIYFIQDTHSKTIKIGVSKTPLARMADLQTAHHAKLILLGVMDGMQREEKALHGEFTRLQGEWFEPTPDLLRYIRDNTISLAQISAPAASPTIRSAPRLRTPPHRLVVIRDAALLVTLWIAVACIFVLVSYKVTIAVMPLLSPVTYWIVVGIGSISGISLARHVSKRLM